MRSLSAAKALRGHGRIPLSTTHQAYGSDIDGWLPASDDNNDDDQPPTFILSVPGVGLHKPAGHDQGYLRRSGPRQLSPYKGYMLLPSKLHNLRADTTPAVTRLAGLTD